MERRMARLGMAWQGEAWLGEAKQAKLNTKGVKMLYVGVDPGWSGAIAILSDDSVPVGTVRFTETPQDIADWFGSFWDQGLTAMIESVGATPQMGVVSAFKFGKAAGLAWGLLLSHRIRHEFVAPTTWQKALKCLSKGDKNVTKRAAQALWPSLKITHATADALLIAEYCRRVNLLEG